MAGLSIERVSKAYGAVRAVDDVSLEIGDAELVALLGPSGCGKTTLLRMIAGFLPVTAGRMAIAGRDVTQLPPHKRGTGMVFQSYALFPHMTVFENVAFGLKMRKVPAAEAATRVAEALRLVRLGGMDERYPRQLSGGQQQRVAIARALVIRPDVFLLDEPLSNLDAKLRQSVGVEIRALQRSLGLTTVFVTHDQNEALTLADRIVVMDQGRIVQTGSASELYTRPANLFVASFLGRANLLRGRVEGPSRFVTDEGQVVAVDTAPVAAGARGVLCLRPENLRIGPEAEGMENRFSGQVVNATYLGSLTEYAVRLGAGETTLIAHHQNREGTPEPARPTEEAAFGWRPSSGLLLPDA